MENGAERLDRMRGPDKPLAMPFSTYPGTYMFNSRRSVGVRVAETVESAKSGPISAAGLKISDPAVAEEVGRELIDFHGRLPFY
jgi:hypothetical protein